jgi:uncharacterized protein YcaQ
VTKELDVLTTREARLLALIAQRLDGIPRARKRPDKSTIYDLICHLGAVQLDTISVVARSHETVLWSRLGQYDINDIAVLYEPDRLIGEYWAHAAAIIPISTLRYYRRQMLKLHDPTTTYYQRWGPEPEVNAFILEQVRENGPLMSRHFERTEGPKPEAWSWYGGKPTNIALDFLWSSGHLVIHQRTGFQRVYEIAERKFPNLHDGPLPSVDEEQRFFVQASMSAMGVVTPKWVADYFRFSLPYVNATKAATVLKTLENEGLAIRFAVPFMDEPVWVDPKLLPDLERIRAGKVRATRTTLLTPFDSLIWDRARASSMFSFDYLLEIYVPATKRRYGYYNMAILNRGGLVGRLDPSYDRKRKVLTIKAIHLEPGVKPSERLAADLGGSLRDYVQFMGGGEVIVLNSDPPTFAELLRSSL